MTRSLGCPTPKGGSAPGTLSFPAGHLWLYGFGRNRQSQPAQVAAFFDRNDHTSPGRRPRSIQGNVTFPASTRRDARCSIPLADGSDGFARYGRLGGGVPNAVPPLSQSQSFGPNRIPDA